MVKNQLVERKSKPGVVISNELDRIGKRIKDLTDKRVLEFLSMTVNTKNVAQFHAKMDQAKLGLLAIREREVARRIQNGQSLRVISMISTDTEERREYIEVSMPKQ